MGFLDRFRKGKSDSTDAPVKGKKPKQKKSKKGGRKQLTLVERMQLQESVAAATLDVVSDQANDDTSAIRQIGEGYVIVAFTNEMLEELGLDHNSEEFGSFAEGLSSEAIESISLASDLMRGVIGLIPSHETLMTIDEYDFIHDMSFQWALVPENLSDDDELVLLDNTVGIDQLVFLANNPDATVELDGRNIVISNEVEDFNHQENDVSGYVDTDLDSNESIDDPDDDDEGLHDDFGEELGEFEDEPFFDDDFETGDSENDTFDSSFEDDGVEDIDYEEEFGISLDEDGDDDIYIAPDEPLDDDMLTPQESIENVNKLTEQVFKNDELGLSADVTIFDNYFDSLDVAQFDMSHSDNDSELGKVVYQLRKDANAELRRVRQDGIQSLRNNFMTSLHSIHDKLVDAVDHRNPNTSYGQHMQGIEDRFKGRNNDIDIEISTRSKELRGAYDESKEVYAQHAYDEALISYDRQYRDELVSKLDVLREVVQSDIRTDKDIEVGEMLNDKRLVSKRLYDRAITSLMLNMQSQYQEIANRELKMFDAFRKNIDAYMREHFSDDVLRAKAQAEVLRQSHEAEKVRQEYEQMLTTKQKQMEAADEASRESLRQVEKSHAEHVQSVRSDFERLIEREQRDNKELRVMLQDSQSSNSKIIADKEKEVEHRFNTYQHMLESKDNELAYANERLKASEERAVNATKPLWYVVVAAGIVSLAIGVLLGFLFGAGQATPKVEHIAPGASIDGGQVSQVIDVSDHFLQYDNIITIGSTSHHDVA